MIKLVNINKHYKKRDGVNRIFCDLNLSIDRENFGIMGKNGVGKSTLLRIIAGIEHVYSGTVFKNDSLSWPIGFMGGFNGSLTAQENCRFVARIYGKDIKSIEEFVIDFSELKTYFYMPIKTYSTGMKARLAFSLSMALDFNTYLVDEITAVGDINFQKKCSDIFNERSKRSNLIMTSHSIEILQKYCSSFGVLNQGKIITFNNINEAAKYYKAIA